MERSDFFQSFFEKLKHQEKIKNLRVSMLLIDYPTSTIRIFMLKTHIGSECLTN